MIAVIMAVKARRWSGPQRQVVGVVELVGGLVVGVVGGLVVGVVPKKGLLLHPAGRLTLQARYKTCGL